MSEQTTPVRTDELRPGDRVWHPFDLVCFTVAHEPKQETGLHFEGEPGLRVTGTTDRGETVHVDVAPAYKWHRGPKATAPTTHDPLVVNTRDGVCWTRRTVTPGGIALYAPEGVRTCPKFVMATLPELAEHGIVGSADVLPVPVGPRNTLDDYRGRVDTAEVYARRTHARINALLVEPPDPQGCALCGAPEDGHGVRVTEGFEHEWVRPKDELVRERLAMRRALEQSASGEPVPSELAWLRARVAELEAQRESDHKTWQHDLRTARDEREVTAVRVAALLEERHVTNEALDDAVQALRATRKEESVEADTLPAWLHWRFGKHGQRWTVLGEEDQALWEHHAAAVRRAVERGGFKSGGNDEALALGGLAEESADGIARRIVPVQALREDEPTDVPCSKCGDLVHWVKSTNSDGGFWRHRIVPGRVLDHFGTVAGSEGRHQFEKEYLGESGAKRRLPNCKVCGRPAIDPAHDEDVTPQVQRLRALLAGQRDAQAGERP
ncbi:hypothetical protein ABT063_24580 [Streptomyces sp. NPDC002838]|uniref:hypothetical protein n=1 Tax=Streptomyces sp. NPDC002838 TaxID=3154436 RepID=UPI0033194BC3